MITIRRQSAVETQMPTLGQCLSNFRAACTGLSGTARVNFNEHASGTLSLVREHKEKVGPPGIVNRLAESASRKPFDIQVLNGDQAVRVHDLPRFFVMEIPSLIANVVVKPLKQEDGLAPAIRSLLSTSDTPLETPEFLLRGTEPSRIVNLCSVAQGRKGAQANINTDCGRTERQRTRFALNHEQSEPASGFSFDGKSLNCAINRSMQLDSYRTDLRESQFVSVNSVADLPKRNAVVSARGSKPWITGRSLGFNAAKESFKGQLHTMQRVLKSEGAHCPYVFALASNVFKLAILIEPRNRFTLPLPRFAPFLKRSVVQLTAQCELIVKHDLLFLCRIDTVAECFDQEPLFYQADFRLGRVKNPA